MASKEEIRNRAKAAHKYYGEVEFDESKGWQPIEEYFGDFAKKEIPKAKVA